jgi:LacI family transcriptional regulator
VAEATRNRILDIIKDMDYQPNILASTLASKKSAVFATLLPKPPSPHEYWYKPVIGIKKRISELSQYGIEVVPFTFSQNDPQSFVDASEKVMQLMPHGVVFAPFFKKESEAFIKQLKESSIPFIFIDSEIKEAGQLGYIGQNSYQSGLVSGKLLDMILREGNILVIHFAREMDNQNHLVQREKGFYDWFSANSSDNHKLFTTEVPDTNNSEWMPKVLEIIQEKSIKGVFVTNSKVFFMGRLIENYGIRYLKIIGHDLLKENIEYLKKDIVQFLICQRPEEQGYNAINKLFRQVVQKRETAEENYTAIDIVIKENVDYYKEFK